MARTDLVARHAEDTPAAVKLLGGGPDGAVDVPLDPDAPLPIVEAMVAGEGPFRFGVETGAQFVGMRVGLAAELGLTELEETIGLPRHLAPSITIGGAEFSDVPVMEIRTAATDIDGILGFPFWRDVLVTVDYPAQRLRIEHGVLPAPGGNDSGDVLPIVPVKDGDFLGVDITIGDRAFVGLVDTRSMGALGFTPESAGDVEFDGELQVIGMARGAAIPETEVYGGRLAYDVVLGRHRLVRPFVSVRPLPEHFPTEPVIGTVVLRNFRLTLDLANARIRLDRPGDITGPIELPMPRRQVIVALPDQPTD